MPRWNVGRTLRFLCALCAAPAAIGAAAPPPPLDTARIATQRFGQDAPWYVGRIPFFESSDARLDAVYYYRWSVFRAHQRDVGEKGFLSTEFLDDVSWQLEPYASLNDATGFHIGEGRWLRDRRYAGDYIDYMYGGGNDRHFTDYLADAVYGRFLVDGDRGDALRHLGAMKALYAQWDDHYDASKGLYWVEPLLDATEYTISSIDASGGKDGFRGGDAFRPSINAYMFANARAIARLATLAGDAATARDYAARADRLRSRVQDALWSPTLHHFIDRYKVDNEYVKYWTPIRGRELVGYLPWTFDLPDGDAKFDQAWQHLLVPDRLAGAAGLRTVEPSYPYYLRQYRYEGVQPECQWNGPSWPYQTTQVLLAMANRIARGDGSPVTRTDYLHLLRQYAAQHFQGERLDLEEDYHPESGRPIVGLARSHHYFHSGYVDLILSGLVGIRPRADDRLTIDPMLPDPGRDPAGIRWFRVQDVPYHGHRIAVLWDHDGRHYGDGPGLTVLVDGHRAAHRATLGPLDLPLATVANAPAPPRAIDRAVQLVRGKYPMGSASSNADVENVHDAIDGRLWFFPELPNGWSSAPGVADQWYAVDLGKPVRLDRTELAFFADGQRFAVPLSYRMQAWTGTGWRDLPARADKPVANGVTHARWPALTTSKVRVTMRQPVGRALRLVELKLF